MLCGYSGLRSWPEEYVVTSERLPSKKNDRQTGVEGQRHHYLLSSSKFNRGVRQIDV
jgi:hypothetical protein